MSKLTTRQIDAAIKDAPEWTNTGEAIQRTIQFPDFAAAMAFVNRIAAAAEQAQHHPDILIRYNKVTFTLSTHDAAGLTKRDFDFARRIDAMLTTK
ncbi:MAG: 4a-hydroxytetrahydrobiopterin dehydratase [Phycisphaerales bacterium]|nr:4a-hydroxytetrahydrobiopterin dehydratase [Phycisphaerales bacterium]